LVEVETRQYNATFVVMDYLSKCGEITLLC
jgi:hypothetical protein